MNGSASLPYSTNWGAASKVNDQAQVVDGKWGIDGNNAHIQAMGYDRIVSIGDISWHDYEATVPVRVDGLGPGHNTPLSNEALVGFGLNWRGHTQAAGKNTQPGYWWYPTGALGWYRWFEPTNKFELFGNGNSPVAAAQPVPADVRPDVHVQDAVGHDLVHRGAVLRGRSGPRARPSPPRGTCRSRRTTGR